MKSLKHYIRITISSLLLVAGLTSCGNLLLPETEVAIQAPEQRMTGSVTGTISIEGALPSQMANQLSANTRTAFPNPDLSNDFTYFVKAEGGGVNTQSTTFTGNTFSLSNLEFGVSYTITVWVFKKSAQLNLNDPKCFTGTYEGLTVTAAKPSVTLEEPITLTPQCTGTGAINLPITSKCSSVKSVSVWVNSDLARSINFSYSQGSSTIYFEKKDCASSPLSLTFAFFDDVDGNGNMLYHCKQMVNVINGCVTDTWYRNGMEEYLKEASSGAAFVIDQSCLDNFARSAWFVNSKVGASGRGTPNEPFKTFAEAVEAAQNSNSDDMKYIFIMAGSTVDMYEVNDSGLAISAGGIQQLTIDVYGATAEHQTAEIQKTSSFDTMWIYGTLNVSNIVFSNNGIEHPDYPGFIWVLSDDSNGTGSVNLTNCTFNTEATGNEALINVQKGSLNAKSCTFTGTKYNLAIQNSSTLTLDSCTFNIPSGGDNTAIRTSGPISLAGKNTFNDDQKIVLSGSTPITLDSTFSTSSSKINLSFVNHVDWLNKACLAGEAYIVRNFYSFFKLSQSEFLLITSEGILKALITVTDGTRTECYSTLDDAFTELNKTTESIFTGNNLTIILHYIGDYYNYQINGFLTISDKNLTIRSDVANSSPLIAIDGIKINGNSNLILTDIQLFGSGTPSTPGGLINLDDSSIQATFNHCIFWFGYTPKEGGAIYNKGTVTLNDCTFNQNYSGTDGGAIYNNGTLTLNNCTFDNIKYQNTTDGHGSAVYCTAGSDLTISGGTNFSGHDIYIANTSTTTNAITLSDTSNKAGTITFATPIDGLQVFTGTGASSAKNWFTLSNEGWLIDASGELEEYKPITVTDGTITKKYADLNSAINDINTSSGVFNSSTATIEVTLDHTIDYTLSTDNSGTTNKVKIVSDNKNHLATINMSCPFSVMSSNGELELNSLHLVGAFTNSSGGGLLAMQNFQGAPTATCINCTFENGNTSNNGGAISNYGNLTLNGCSFSGNTAVKGNGVYCSSSSTLILEGNCSFDNNTIYLDGSSQIALNGGGNSGIVEVASPSAGRSVFTGPKNDSAKDSFTCANEGWAFNSEGKLVSTVLFVDGDAVDHGDGTADSPYQTLREAIEGINGQKGTIWIKENTTIEESQEIDIVEGKNITIKVTDDFTTLSSDTDKRATIKFTTSDAHLVIMNHSVVKFTGIKFERWEPLSGNGGFIYLVEATASLECCQLDGGESVAQECGGAVFAQNGVLNITSCNILNCRSNQKGGAIYSDETDLHVNNSTFTSNCDTNEMNINDIYTNGNTEGHNFVPEGDNTFEGGVTLGLKASKYGTIQITEVFSNQSEIKIRFESGSVQADKYSGQILTGDYISSALPYLTITGYDNLYFDEDGYIQDESTNPPTTLYVGGSNAKDKAGFGRTTDMPYATLAYALSKVPETNDMHNQTTIYIQDNLTEENNLSFYTQNIKLTSNTSEKRKITITNHIRIYISSIVSFTNLEFTTTTGTTEDKGGALFQIGWDNDVDIVTFTNCTFKTSGFEKNGGAVYCYGGSNVKTTFTNCDFQGCSTNLAGGAIYNEKTTIEVNENTTFKECYSACYGGAILNDGTMTLSDCTFDTCNSYFLGGAIYNYAGAVTISGQNTSFTGCTAGGAGGAIYNQGTLLIEGSPTFSDCIEDSSTPNFIYSYGSDSSTTLDCDWSSFVTTNKTAFIHLSDQADVTLGDVCGAEQGDSIYFNLDTPGEYAEFPFLKDKQDKTEELDIGITNNDYFIEKVEKYEGYDYWLEYKIKS